MIEQQQETLDESVKTILKLYSLNNERGDDLSVLSEEKLKDMARAMVPRLSTRDLGGRFGADRGDRGAPPQDREESDVKSPTGSYGRRRESAAATANRTLSEDVDTLMQERESQLRARSRGRTRLGEGGEATAAADEGPSGQLRARSRGRARLGEDVESEISQIRARSRGRVRPSAEDMDDSNHNKPPPSARARSRGRGERTESIRALTERARTPARDRSRSPNSGGGDYVRRRSSDQYDPSGPVSDSRALVMTSAEPAVDSLALVPVEPRKDGYGGYDVPPPMSSSRGGGGGPSRRDDRMGSDRSAYGGDRDRGDPYGDRDGRNYSDRSSRYREGGSRHHPSSSGGGYRGDRGGHGDPRMRSEREHRSSQSDHRDRYYRGGGGGMDDPYYRGDRDRDSRGGGYPPRERERRGSSNRQPSYDDYRSGRPQQQGRDPSVAGDASYGGGGHRHRDRRHSRRQREVMEP